MLQRRARTLWLTAFLWITILGGGRAIAAEVPPPIIADVAPQIDTAEGRIHAVEAATRRANLTDQALQAEIARLVPGDQALDAAVATLTPRLSAIDARLAELGSPPTATQPAETEEITHERAQLVTNRETVASELKQARLLTVETDQLTARLEQRRRELFSRHLWTPSRSILSPYLWQDFVAALPADGRRLSVLVAAEGRQAKAAAARPGAMPGWLAALIAAALILVPGRRLLNAIGQRWAAKRGAASPLYRSLLAVWLVIVAAGTPLVAIWLVRAVLVGTGALTVTFASLVDLILPSVVFAALIEGLGRALLSPRQPDWRLAPGPDALAQRLAAYPLILAVTVAVATLVSRFNTALGFGLATSITTDCITLLIELLVIAATLIRAGSTRASLPEQGSGDRPGRGSPVPWVVVSILAWLGLIVAAIAVVVGYLALASFIMRELVWIAVVLVSLYLLIHVVDDLVPALLGPGSRLGRTIRLAIGVSEPALAQLSILLAGFARVVLLLFGWTLIIAPFGAGASDIFGRVSADALVIHIGEVSISPGAIVGSIVILLIGLLITRSIRAWLEANYLPSTGMEIGVRASLGSAVTYVGVIFAVVLASAFLGISLDRIALFASALSIGIGFGLQSIISNFVSGLILMVERPVKVGDWIAIGDLEGDVRKVSVRATEIEMMDRSRLIVPNLDLITKTVRNVTYNGALGRVRIVLRVADDADPVALQTLIMARLTAHPKVLSEPPPAVYMTDVRDGGLEFTSFAFVASARDVYRTRSELLFQIVPDLKTHGFALANSAPIVNLGVDGRPIEPTLVRS